MDSSNSKKRKRISDELKLVIDNVLVLYKHFKKLRKENANLENRISKLEEQVALKNDGVDKRVSKLEEEVRSANESSKQSNEISYYDGSSTLVNSVKLNFCISSDFNEYVSKSLMLIFSIRELYRHNIKGGTSFVDNVKKRPLDYLKMIEIFNSVKQRFPYLAERFGDRGLRTRMNAIIMNKIAKLNRSFKEVKANYLAGSNDRKLKHPFSGDEKYLLENLDIYLKDPSLFIQLDNIIDGNVSVKQEKEIELEQDLIGLIG